ncbi:MAG: hypothetical protein MK066_06140 [Crocinitomicaceae bacterium]|nr:hypothetical protein [Crocinitomicaceae bacterium]
MVYDITLLTDGRYLEDRYDDLYSQNVVKEDGLVKKALERKGLKVHRTNWDDPNFDWSSTRFILFRTTWDYFDRFKEFSKWLEFVCTQTKLINPKEMIYWNIDKHYLQDIEKKGVRIPKTIFIEPKDSRSLHSIIDTLDWKEFILKPAVSGAARHTYRFTADTVAQHETTYKDLISEESMLLQEFQHNVLTKGEVAFIVFGGKYSHAVLKKAKPGDFRVQDDFGGSLHDYEPSADEISFIEEAIKACNPIPVYARVDVIWNNENELCIGEIELIEPELWFRRNEKSADHCAQAIRNYIEN